MAKKTKRAASPAVHFSKKFDSLYDLSEWLKDNKITDGWDAWPSSIMGSKKFTDTENFIEAENLMLNGWDYGKNEITKIMMDRAECIQEVKRLALSYVGAVPCVPAYLAGSPKNMLAIRRRPVSRPVVSIVYNCIVASEVNASNIMMAAAKLFNVVRGLELGGVSVELWAGLAGRAYTGNDTITMAVKIKSASQPLNVLNMCYPVVHPSFARRHCFALYERAGFDKFNWEGYGRCVNGDSAKIQLAGLEIPNFNYFDYYAISDKTETEIAKMIK